MDSSSILHRVKKEFFFFTGTVVQDLSVISFCRFPYDKRHPVGCPNWNHKKGCPPHTKPFLSVYHPLVKIVIARLDFSEYLRLKREIHPDWTDKALRNPRHWQGHLRASLKIFLSTQSIPQGYRIVNNAEAMGINLFETCANAGFVLERSPQNYVCQVNLLAKPNHS